MLRFEPEVFTIHSTLDEELLKTVDEPHQRKVHLKGQLVGKSGTGIP